MMYSTGRRQPDPMTVGDFVNIVGLVMFVVFAVIHVDAHADMNDAMFGEPVTHGTIFRRAIEEELINPELMMQVIQAQDCWYQSLAPLMDEFRKKVGPEQPVYLSFDIDGLDPSCAPGTGTPEPGGLTSSQGIEIIRGLFRPEPYRCSPCGCFTALRHNRQHSTSRSQPGV